MFKLRSSISCSHLSFVSVVCFAIGLGASISTGILICGRALAAESEPAWQLADRRGTQDDAIALFVESTPTPGRPSFRLETRFDVPPELAQRVLLDRMLDPSEAPKGQRRTVLERGAMGAVVRTFIDLPLMLADREVALRVEQSHDPGSGIYRVDWHEANELLPPAASSVVRLTGTIGYWEFQPDGQGGTKAIHMTRAEIGGSFPAALGDRLMKAQAVESVESLRRQITRHTKSAVAAGPP